MTTHFSSVHFRAPTSLQLYAAPPKNKTDLEQVVARIRLELLVLQQRQVALSKRISSIRNAVTGLAEIFGPELITAELRPLLCPPLSRRSRPRPGLTDVCRKSLRESSHPVTLPEILQIIRQQHPLVLANHKNPRVSVSVVLRRLVDYSQAEAILQPDGQRAWRWTSTNHLEAAPYLTLTSH
jgi:hypothetical protein